MIFFTKNFGGWITFIILVIILWFWNFFPHGVYVLMAINIKVVETNKFCYQILPFMQISWNLTTNTINKVTNMYVYYYYYYEFFFCLFVIAELIQWFWSILIWIWITVFLHFYAELISCLWFRLINVYS